MRHRFALLALLSGVLVGPALAGSKPVPTFSVPIVGPTWTFDKTAWAYRGAPIDLDQDGHPEIVFGYAHFPPRSMSKVPIVILGYDGKEKKYSNQTLKYITGERPAFTHPRTFSIGDFNGDGIQDIFLGGHGYDAGAQAGERDWLLLSVPGARHRTKVVPPGLLTYTHASASGDVDGDGVDDIYVGITCCSKFKFPYFVMGHKNADPTVDRRRIDGTAIENAYLSANLTDVDGDGRPDLILGGYRQHPNVVLHNKPGGFFDPPAPKDVLPSGLFGVNTTTPYAINVDFDSDGHPDIVFSQYGADVFNGPAVGYGLQLLRGNGKGKFVDDTKKRLLGGNGDTGDLWKETIFLADFYGDGIPDLVAHLQCGPAKLPMIWINDGSGIFTPYARDLVEPGYDDLNCDTLIPTDIDGDGRTDFVRVIESNGALPPGVGRADTILNTGNGSAPTAAPIVARQPQAATVANGSPLLLSVAGRGGRPMKFQWFHDGKAIADATRPVYRVDKAAATTAGNYWVTVGNAKGKAISRKVQVTVN